MFLKDANGLRGAQVRTVRCLCMVAQLPCNQKVHTLARFLHVHKSVRVTGPTSALRNFTFEIKFEITLGPLGTLLWVHSGPGGGGGGSGGGGGGLLLI
jgi:hypothetical protein